MAIKISSASNVDTQCCQFRDKKWVIQGLISLAEKLPVKEMPLEHLNISNIYPMIENARNWLGHVKAILDADLNYPIILDDEGDIMDGRHRVAKAILEGKATIKYVRFDKTPPWDYVVSED